ncbi:MAG: DNA mismatch repair endonuclease MutL [Cryomorphaceae bacterium]|nr:DNA mismatch repair endonuclease MutL [Cryomorphaceae bacterium]
MRDLIQLLPDNVANQIAAGEVVQRPASVVKELLENAIDAGAKNIQLIVKDAGKTLIQVIDNGKGMSENDLRMAFERHATSKIRSANDLFNLTTMGFRGEALASIAAVAQVRCSSRMADDEVASTVEINGGKLTNYGQDALPVGTSLEVKNLFFNIPARRQFLKKDQVEINHITDEFQRVALANPQVAFRFFHNNAELFNLPISKPKLRIVNIFGKKYDQRLVPVDEQTEHLRIRGFVGKPDSAKKRRGEQFFFVNNRFIKSPFLHHAVQKAFTDLIPHGYHPSYFLFFDVDPATIDVNIHPTKTEIKFTDENMVFAMLASAVKHGLGKHNVAPSLDFELGSTFTLPKSDPNRPVKMPEIKVNSDYNPFSNPTPGKNIGHAAHNPKSNPEEWASIMPRDIPDIGPIKPMVPEENGMGNTQVEVDDVNDFSGMVEKFGGKFLLCIHGDQLHFIHPRRAHERILFEAYNKELSRKTAPSQQLLFPQTIDLSADEKIRITPWLSEMTGFGFDVEINENQLNFYGLPVNLNESSLPEVMEALLDDLQDGGQWDSNHFHQKLIRNLAKNSAIRNIKNLQKEELNHLAEALFLCDEPFISLHGKPTVFTVTINELEKYFN